MNQETIAFRRISMSNSACFYTYYPDNHAMMSRLLWIYYMIDFVWVDCFDAGGSDVFPGTREGTRDETGTRDGMRDGTRDGTGRGTERGAGQNGTRDVTWRDAGWDGTRDGTRDGTGLKIRFQRPLVRTLHSVEEDNSSPFDVRIACLCHSSTVIYSKYVCVGR